MWIVCLADDSHEIASLIFSEKKIRMPSAAVVTGVWRVIMVLFQPGDIVLDPLCGKATVLLEAAHFHKVRKWSNPVKKSLKIGTG